MADRNLKKRSDTPAGNFGFHVKIFGVTDADTVELELPVDAVRGLGDGRTSTIRHRPNGFSATTQTPFPGLSVPDAVTLEGSWLYDMGDLRKLQSWRDQVKGKLLPGAIGGIYRDITIHPTADNEFQNTVITGDGTLRLSNCIAVRLTVADFDINAPAVSNWSLEVEFEDMSVLGG